LHFVALAERASQKSLANEDYEESFRALDAERDNLRAAIDWSSHARELELEARFIVGLRQFWIVRGHLREARAFAERAVADTTDADDSLRALVLAHAGVFPFRQGDLARARELWEEALALYRALDDADGVTRCFAELGGVALAEGDLERATEVYVECCELFEQLGNPVRLGTAVSNLAVISSMRGDLDGAVEYGERAIEIARECDRDGLAVSLHNLARTRLALGQLDEARDLLGECVELATAIGYNEVIAHALAAAAELALRAGRLETAARLLGGSEALFDEIGAQMQGDEEEARARTLAELRESLGDDRLDELLDEGRVTDLAELTREAAGA
jgi:tetratricopeptide (TPR) repeat protein